MGLAQRQLTFDDRAAAPLPKHSCSAFTSYTLNNRVRQLQLYMRMLVQRQEI